MAVPPSGSHGASSPGSPPASYPASRRKLDELFAVWLGTQEAQEAVAALLAKARAGTLARAAQEEAGGGNAGAPPSPPKAPSAAGAGASPARDGGAKTAQSVASPSPSPTKGLTRRGSHANIIPTFFHGARNGAKRQGERAAEAATEITAALAHAAALSKGQALTPEGFVDVLRNLAGLPVYFAPCVAHALRAGGPSPSPAPPNAPPPDALKAACAGVTEEALRRWWLGDGKTQGACHATVAERAFDALLHGGVEARGDAEGATTMLGGFGAAAAGTLTPAHFGRMLGTFANHHPGLEFLQPSQDFQQRYIDTVAFRMFYHNNRRGNMRMTRSEFSKSDIVDVLSHACYEEPDVNRILRYLSYESFYVIYCRFWELDGDRDFVLSFDDVLRYNGHALTSRCIERIVAGYGRPHAPHVAMRRKLQNATPARQQSLLAPLSAAERALVTGNLMTYEDFTYFLVSEEDKTSDVAAEYWMRILDVDDDGVLSARDMWYFYEEQLNRMECLSQEPVSFEDILCQIADMAPGYYPYGFSERGSALIAMEGEGETPSFPAWGARETHLDRGDAATAAVATAGSEKPEEGVLITLRTLKSHRRLASHVLDALVNWGKFTLYECRDPQLVRLERECSTTGFTDWDRFARFEYSRLSAEEEEEAQQSAG